MTDVTDDNGPFTFAVGSHRLHNPLLIDRIEETNDQSGACATDPASRLDFAALPAVLRRKCAFGNDVLPGTEIVERVVPSEWSITAPQGHIVVFDTKGFHRGGMVRKGERRVLTMVLG